MRAGQLSPVELGPRQADPAGDAERYTDATQSAVAETVRGQVMSEPDYGSYTLEALLDAEQHINGDRYPERLARLRAEIRARRRDEVAESGNTGDAQPETTVPTEPTKAVPIVMAVAMLLLAGVTVLCGRNIVQFFKSFGGLESIAVALSKAYPDQQVHITIKWNPRHGENRRMILSLTDSPWSTLRDKDRRQKAMELAGVAFAAYPKADRVTHVLVVFRSTGGLGPATILKQYRFAPSDLDRVGPDEAVPFSSRGTVQAQCAG